MAMTEQERYQLYLAGREWGLLRRLEKQVDAAVREVLLQPTLFGEDR